MTKQLYLIQAAASAVDGTFRRLGRSFSAAGSVVNRADFSDADWAILEGEKSLKITPAADDGAATAAGQVADEALRALVKEALGKLDPAEFGEGGVPSANAVRRVLPTNTKGVTASLVTEVWASLQPPPAA
jgi:hypothetical protein